MDRFCRLMAEYETLAQLNSLEAPPPPKENYNNAPHPVDNKSDYMFYNPNNNNNNNIGDADNEKLGGGTGTGTDITSLSDSVLKSMNQNPVNNKKAETNDEVTGKCEGLK